MTPHTPPAPRPRPAAHRTPAADVESVVLDTADRLVADAGPAAITIRRLATEAGVAPMTIYNRFGDKAGVLQALFARGFADLHDHTDADHQTGTAATAAESLERLRRASRFYRAFAIGSPGTYALMFDRSQADFEPSAEGIEAAGRSFQALVDLVADAQRTGAVVGGSATEIAQRIWASIHGSVSLELRSICFVNDTDAHFDALVDTLLEGLSPAHGIAGLAG